MNPILLAEGDPFEHTWNTWDLDFVFGHLDLHSIAICRTLGITNIVVMMLVVATALLAMGVAAGNEAKRALAEGRAPRGLGHVFEILVEFVRDAIVKPQMPHHFEKGVINSYFCTIFFFILGCNLIGLVPAPFGHTPTGLFWLNLFLAFGGTLVVMIVAGVAEHGIKWVWTGFVPHGVPIWLAPVIWAIEVFGFFIKPFALTIRLTANMTAGHIILAVLMGFLVADLSVGEKVLVWPPSAFGYLAITAFEVAIAAIQAYIFTTLSAVFVGMSLSHEH